MICIVTPLELAVEELATPIGDLCIARSGERIRAIEWKDCAARMERRLRGARIVTPRTPSDARRTLERYFAGELAAIDALALAAEGTPFQRAVWQALRAIPAGTTASYGALARTLGRPEAARAVGAANGANPIAVVVPCHRLVGAGGALTGYAGGLARKRWLLDHERARAGER